ncbi:MAG: hypothetical protein JNL33_12165 [Betaproteobacteria bacterium]|nr:hypothetical protein [Betaproteobacteria bacterium]
MLAGMFSDGGYFQGDDLYQPREANPKGFFENWTINTLNESIVVSSVEESFGAEASAFLKSYYRDGQYWLARLPAEFRCHPTVSQSAQISALTARTPFAYKDPRFCFTIDAWMDSAPGSVALCVFRHPGAVVRSILHEAQSASYLHDLRISVADLYEGWRNMYLRVLGLRRSGREIYFLHYPDLFETHVQDALETLVGTALNRAFPERRLERQRSDGELDSWSSALFEELIAISSLQFAEQTPTRAGAVLRAFESTRAPCVPRFEKAGTSGDSPEGPDALPIPISSDFVFSPSAIRGLYLRIHESQMAIAVQVRDATAYNELTRATVARMEEKLAALEGSLNARASTSSDVDSALASLHAVLERSLRVEEGHAQRITSLENDLAKYAETISRLRGELDERGSTTDLLVEAHARHTEDLQAQLRQHDQAARELLTKLEEVHSLRSQEQSEREDLRSQLRSAESELDRQRAEKDALLVRLQSREVQSQRDEARHAELAGQLGTTVAELENLRRQNEGHLAEAESLRSSISSLDEQLARRNLEMDEVKASLEQKRQMEARMVAEQTVANERLIALGREIEELQQRIRFILGSKSWRLTAPLRVFRSWLS